MAVVACMSQGVAASDVADASRPAASGLYVSGHSLTDRPYPDYLAALAGTHGEPIRWDMQHLFGSSLADRAWDHGGRGVAAGLDRDGGAARLPQAFEQVLRPARAGALILTEQNSLLQNVLENRTVEHILAYDERLAAVNPAGTTYLLSSWLGRGKGAGEGDWRRWIAYERAAAPAWECVTAEANARLVAAGSGRRIRLIPAAQALAALVEQARRPGGLPGGPEGTLDALFADDVHLHPPGVFFIALVSHFTLHGAEAAVDFGPLIDWPPIDAAPIEPPPIDAAMARALEGFARQFMRARAGQRDPSREACRLYFASCYVPGYLAFVRDTQWRELGLLRAYIRWARHLHRWRSALGPDSPGNPFRGSRKHLGA